MAFIPIPHTCCVELRFLCRSQRVENTLCFATDQDYDADLLEDITEKVGEWWYAAYRLAQRQDVTLTEVYGRDLSDESGPTYTNTTRSGITGFIGAGVALPLNVTFAISFRTTGRGRSYRGRNYVIGLSSGQVSGNQIGASVRNDLLGYYAQLLPGGSFDLGQHIWVVASRYYNKEPRDPGIAIPIVAVTATNDDLDSARRRLTGRGT